MKPVKSAEEIFNMYYLDVRCHLLETAAALDRFDRYGSAALKNDPRYRKIQAALDLLKDGQPQRTERFLNLFSEEA